MSNEVVVAIVSGVVAVGGGIMSWIQAIRTSRLKAETDSTVETIRSEANLAVERMKVENERRQRAFEIASQESKPIETALAQAWHDIQTVKDMISKIVGPAHFDRDLVLESLGAANSSLSEGYAKWGTELPGGAREAWHNAKSGSRVVEMTYGHPFVKGSDSAMSPQALEHLREIRLTLTDSQMIIASTRQTIRDNVARHLTEIL